MNNHMCWKQIGIEGDNSCEKLVEQVHCRNCPKYSAAGRSLFDRQVPEELLQEWTEVISKEKEAEVQNLISVIVFRLRGEWFGLGTVFFQEVTTVRTIHTVPHRTNARFLGLVNVSGELLLCFSAADILGLEPEERHEESSEGMNYRRLVVVKEGNYRCVFPVDEVLGIHRFGPSELQAAPVTLSKSTAPFTKGIVDKEGKKVGILNEEVFLRALQSEF